MITLFRKIRQKFLSQSKLSKYLFYAIGEIVLVVIGILIAVQLNTANQQNTNRKHVESILKSVFVNLESDMSNPILRYIGFCEFKDSLNNLVLNNALDYADYEAGGEGRRGLSRLMNYEFEPFQFEDQAYERLMASIEIIPDEYMPIVNMLQDVYSKEVPVVNEVAMEVKAFVDEIDDKYQTTYDWYSNTDPSHFRQRVEYMLNDPKHLNDVRRHLEIINHLLEHLTTLKSNVAIAYSKIHSQLMHDEPFSELIERFYFPDEGALKEYAGIYKGVDNRDVKFEFLSREYYLALASSGSALKFINTNTDRFMLPSDTEGNYIEFVRNENGEITGLNIFRVGQNGEASSTAYKKTE